MSLPQEPTGRAISRAKNLDELEEQAAEWLQRRDFFEWAAEDQKALDAWLGASISNRVTFWRLDAALSRTERLVALRKPMRKPSEKATPSWPKFARAVAAVAIVAVAASGSFLLQSREKDETISTALGGRKIITLADGSSIELNTASTIRIHADATRRSVTLVKGEAYFDIHHNSARPFTVIAADQRVTDIGTKFVVRALTDRVEVTLIEGMARIAPVRAATKARTADLLPGDIAVATNRNLSVVKAQPAAVAALTSWRNGLLVFHNTELAEVAREFNRYNDSKLIVDGDTANLKVDGTFPNDDPQTFTKIAGDILHLKMQRRGKDFVLSE